MQIVMPIDIEAALSEDLAALTGAVAFAPPAPDDLSAGSICTTSLGGARQTAVSNEHDVSIDCWAATEAEAYELARRACGEVSALPLRTLDSGREYKTASANMPYLNPDPLRPTLPRATFVATVGIRGEAIQL